MKKLFPLIVALLTVGTTIAANAEKLTKRRISACYQSVKITTSTCGAFYIVPGNVSCSTAIHYTNSGYRWLDGTPTGPRAGCDKTSAVFCCITFEEDPFAPPCVPLVTLEESGITARWKVVEVFCKPQ